MEISELRERIDLIDRKLVGLLNQRAKIALKIGKAKQESEYAIRDLQREALVIQKAVSANRGPLSEPVIRKIFTDITEACRELQQQEI